MQKYLALTEEKKALFTNTLKRTRALINFHEETVLLKNGPVNAFVERHIVSTACMADQALSYAAKP
jgi:hypothetical protein